MGGEFGQALSQFGLGFMAETAKNRMAAQMAQKQKQDAFTAQGAQNLARMGELDSLSPEIQKQVEKTYGKEGFATLQQQNQLNKALAMARRGASQTVTQRPVEQAPATAAPPVPEQAGTYAAPAASEQAAMATQSAPQPQAEEQAPQLTREQQAYQNFTNLDPTGVFLLTGNVQAGQLAHAAQSLNFDKQRQLLNIQKNAFAQMKPKITPVFKTQRPDGTLTNSVALIGPDGSYAVTDLSQAPNADEAGRIIDRIASLDEQLARADLTEDKKKTLEQRKKQNAKALKKKLEKGKGGLNVIMGDDGELLGITDDPSLAKKLVALEGATKGLDKKEIATNRKSVMAGALALKTIDRVINMADPRTFGPGSSIFQFTQNMKANIQSAPAIAAAVKSTITGAKTDLHNAESEKLRKKILKDFNQEPDMANQYLLSLVYQLAKLEDPDSVVREGEYDRYKAEILGGGGLAGSFPKMIANLNALKVRVQDRVQLAKENLDRTNAIITQRLGGELGGEAFSPDVTSRINDTAPTPEGTPTDVTATTPETPTTIEGIPEEISTFEKAKRAIPTLTPEAYEAYINQFKKKL